MDIFSKLADARKLLGYSQTEAANRSGLNSKDVSLLEGGKKKFVPESYILFLYNEGIDINSIYSPDVKTVKRAENSVENPGTNWHLNDPDGAGYTITPTLKEPAQTKYRASNAPPTAPPSDEIASLKAQLAQPASEALLIQILTRVSVVEARIDDIYTLLSQQK